MGAYERVIPGHRDQLGEGPLWVAQENALYWVDIVAPAVNRYDFANSQLRRIPMPRPIGWILPRRDRADFIAGLADGFAELSLDPLVIRRLGHPERGLLNNRMNDAKVDSAGRIWAGTMDADAAAAVGSLYRFDTDLRWTKMDEGYVVTNGPTFSCDGAYLYHADSLRRVIYRFELSPHGVLANKIVWVTIAQDAGYPDGMATDAEGCIWVAHYGGGRVTRFAPDGGIERVFELPASQITSCAFGGLHLDRLFVTSAALDREQEPLAGELFEIDPGVAGAPTTSFAG